MNFNLTCQSGNSSVNLEIFYGLTINLVVRKVDFYNNLIFMTT